jgi:class 3 adenylate cyclase/DNA-binding SARP family transcriptional activator
MRTCPPRSSLAAGENKSAAPLIQIDVLGKFKLTRGETPITEKEWSAAKKPQMLLKALITRGAENVPVDLLMDDLWPDSSPDDGKRNFNVVLHRLRKILEHPASSLSTYISLEMNAVSINRNVVRLDIDEFISLSKRLRQADEAGEIKSSLVLGNSIIELYKGDYLEDDLYTKWTMQKRQETRASFIDVLQRMASLYERNGNARKSIEICKLLTKVDPGCEEAYRKLMLLYSHIGMRTEAIRAYDECKRVLRLELDVDPDELTTSIYRRIAESERYDKERGPLDLDRPRSYTPKYLVERVLTSRSSIEGERKIVTVMFADVANSAAVFGGLDPETVHEIMDGCFRLLLEEVHRFEGTINQFLGDGVIALFGAPVAHEDHAQRACHAALAIQMALAPYAESLKDRFGIDFKMRMGLNCGPVVVGSVGNDLRMDYMARGNTVNLAAAMENQAGPGEVLVTKHLFRLAGEYFEFESIGSVQSAGEEKSAAAYRLIGSKGVETRFAVSAARGLTRFIGRAHEMKALTEAFDSVRSGEGRVIGITGEAGVGKSRLLLEFKNSLLKRECRYFEGRCLHYGRSMPYLPLLDVLRSLIGVKEGDPEDITKQKLAKRIDGLGKGLREIIPSLQELLSLAVDDEAYAGLAPKQKRERTFGAVRELIMAGARDRPMVLAIEDLHWIDRTTEELLEHMIGWLPWARLLLLLLYRNEYSHPWGSKSRYVEIGLGQLSGNRSAEMVAAILGGGSVSPELSALIFSKSEGNPFFLEELTFSMIQNGAITKTEEHFVLRADASAMEVPDTVQGVIAARMDRLEESAKRIMQVAAVIGREFALSILEKVSEIKGGLKSALATLQRMEFIQRKALSAEPEYLFRHALTREVAYNSLLVHRRKEIHELIGKAVEELYPQRPEDFYEMLAWHYSHSDNPVKACRFLKLSGQKAARGSSHREALRLFTQALEVLHRMPKTPVNDLERLEVLRLTISPLRALGHPADSLELFREGEKLAKELGDEKALVQFFNCIGLYYLIAGGDPALGQIYIEKGLSASECTGEVEIIAPAVFNLVNSYCVKGELSKICEVAPGCIELIEKTRTQLENFGGTICIYPVLMAQYGNAMGFVGNFDRGERLLEKSHECARQIDNPISLAWIEWNHGIFCCHKGEGQNVVARLKEAARLFEKGRYVALTGIAWAWAGYGYLLLEQPEEALQHLQKGLAIHLGLGIPLWLGSIHAYLSLACLQLGNPGEALLHAQKAVELSCANNEILFEARAAMYLGRALGVAHPARFDQAEEHILHALKKSEELKIKPMTAECRFNLGVLSASAGRVEEAREHLLDAEAMFREMGMDYWLSTARAALAKLR